MRQFMNCFALISLLALSAFAHAADLGDVLKYMPALPAEYADSLDFSTMVPAVNLGLELSRKNEPATRAELIRFLAAIKEVYRTSTYPFFSIRTGGHPNKDRQMNAVLAVRIQTGFAYLFIDHSENLESMRAFVNAAEGVLANVTERELPTKKIGVTFKELRTFRRDPDLEEARAFASEWKVGVEDYLKTIRDIAATETHEARCETLMKFDAVIERHRAALDAPLLQ